MNNNVLIVGAGLGGLSTALRLSKRGFNVQIVEKNSTAGGRLNRIQQDGFTWDAGPTFFSMTYEFTEFLKDIDSENQFEFDALEPLYSVNFINPARKYQIFKDKKKLAEQFRYVESDFERKIDHFLEKTGAVYHDTENRIIKRNFDTLLEYLLQLFKVPIKHLPLLFHSFWDEVASNFHSRDVREIFSLVAFFLGGTPYDTSAVYTLLNYVELKHNGYHNVKGGMYKLVEFLLKKLQEANITVHYNTEIIDYKNKGKYISSLTDSNGNSWNADLFIVNADAALWRGKIFGRRKFSESRLDRMKWTMAPFTIYLGIKGKLPNLEQHNYFLGDNFRDYAGSIFKNRADMSKPYYYVNVISKNNPECAPSGCESIYILCPVPHLQFKPDWSDKDNFSLTIINDLSHRISYNLQDNILTQKVMTPLDWESGFNLHRGSGLSLAHNLDQMASLRPRNYDEKFRNVFYVGASTVPGTGLPMVIISSKLVVERICKYYGHLS